MQPSLWLFGFFMRTHDAAAISAILAIVSPQRRCGKSTLKEGKLPLDIPLDEIANFSCVCKQVSAERGVGYINVANARAGRPVNLIQLVWPDEKGHFPWQKKFDKKLRRFQLSLYHQAS